MYVLTSTFSSKLPHTYESSTRSLHDALPICLLGTTLVRSVGVGTIFFAVPERASPGEVQEGLRAALRDPTDRKSTRLNSSHLGISYGVFCLQKKINLMHKNMLLVSSCRIKIK